MKSSKIIGLLVLAAGVVMLISGAMTWGLTSSQLASEKITVAPDADNFAGAEVKGPLTAFAQAEVVKKHTMQASNGLTYAELGAEVSKAEQAGDKEKAEELQKTRTMVETGNFVRSSLLTSVMAFGVSALVAGLGLLFALVGWALTQVGAPIAATVTAKAEEATA
ncbi:MAG: hypothetical protein Q4D96_10415 [Propionibacteriaceae bacterium]|nr:hypothetical protein [Propionibacteriaceae bacterium]